MVRTVLPSRIFDNGPGASPSWSLDLCTNRAPDHHWLRAQSRTMPRSVANANGLCQQKSDCTTFVPEHRAAAPRSADVDARAGKSEDMISPDAECARVARRHVHDNKSFTRA